MDTQTDEFDFFPFGTPAVRESDIRKAGPLGSNRDDVAVAERDNRRVLRSKRPSRSKVR